MEIHPIKADVQILKIRLSAARRNTYIGGSIFLVAFLAFFLAGMLGYLDDREIYLITAILVAFGFSVITSVIKYEVAKALTDFAVRLSRDNLAV